MNKGLRWVQPRSGNFLSGPGRSIEVLEIREKIHFTAEAMAQGSQLI